MAYSGVIRAKKSDQQSRSPYLHQKDALAARDKLNTLKSYSTLLVLMTGGDKTYTASTWLLTHALDEGKKVLWMAHRHMLLDQAAESFKNFAYLDVIPHKGSFFCRIISGAHENSASINAKDDLLIVSKDSIRSHLARLDAWLAGEDEIYFVVDEAHRATAKIYKRIIEYIKSKVKNLKIIGLTATPTRTFQPEQPLLAAIFPDGIGDNGQPFNNANTPNRLGMVYKIGLKELIQQEILSRPKFDYYERQIEYGENLGIEALKHIQKLDSLPKDLEEAIARDEGRNKLIVESYKKNAAKYGKTLVFTVSIEHTKILTERFNQAGIKASYVVSDTPHDERERIYNAYRNGDFQILVNSSKIPVRNRLRDKFA